MRTHVDRGGTFTDVVVLDDDGGVRVRKVPSDVAVVGELAEGALTFGTTVATHALLERRGVRTALFVTEGFADLPWIAGADHALPLRVAADDDAGSLLARFDAEHSARYGFMRPGHAVEIVNVRVRVTAPAPPPVTVDDDPWGLRAVTVRGPHLITSPTTAVHVPAGWTARRTGGLLRLERDASDRPASSPAATVPPRADPRYPRDVELWNNRFQAVADDAGGVLRRLARSVNIKERLDFSCAVFDAAGRVLADAPVPLNEGCLERVRLTIPAPSILAPSPDAAVVGGGNVETSQRLVDLFLRAAGARAASAGTMNNLALGGPGWSFYETLGGGLGASPACPGASGRQLHMTNTRATDVEVLEARLPLRVRRFALRPGSGGAGAHRGGDGLVRELEVTAPATATLLAAWRPAGAPGLAGGAPGAPGFAERRDGGRWLPWTGDPIALVPGDRVRVHTPSGGGFGPAPSSPEESPP